MRHRAGRVLFTILAAISLLLSVATCVLWVRSYWRADAVLYRSFRAADAGRRDSLRFDALSSSARLVVKMDTQQILRADPSLTFAASSQATQGWSFGAYPARPPVLPSKPRFNALGLCANLQWGRETPLKNYFPGVNGGTMRTGSMFLAIPHWMVVLIGSALPAWWWFAYRRKLLRLYRLDRGLCISCGYDLRATPDEGGALLERCPECGTPVAAK